MAIILGRFGDGGQEYLAGTVIYQSAINDNPSSSIITTINSQLGFNTMALNISKIEIQAINVLVGFAWGVSSINAGLIPNYANCIQLANKDVYTFGSKKEFINSFLWNGSSGTTTTFRIAIYAK